MRISDLRAKARDTLEHNLFGNLWITLVVLVFLFGVIVGIPGSLGNGLSIGSVALFASLGVISFALSILIEGPMEYGLTRVMTNVARKSKKADIKDLFVGYKEALTESVVLGLLRIVFIFLWTLLLIVPGIIKAYAYSMAYYIQQDSEDKEWRSCLDKSQEMMRGYKGKLFLLDLSFIGWYIVGAICLGVGMLWVAAYHSVARAHFYEELKNARAAEVGEARTDDLFTNDTFDSETDSRSDEQKDELF